MSTSRLKLAFIVSIIALILMIVSLFGTWYVWDGESNDNSREFTREWKLHSAHDRYSYNSSKGDEAEITRDSVDINYDSEEDSYRTGKRQSENKYATDYEKTVKGYYLLYLLVIISAGILITFSSGIGISFLKNVDRSNILVLGGLAFFFCILPAILQIFLIGPSMTEDNDSYEVETRPDDDNYEKLYRYELEGAASTAKMEGISGSTNTTFDNSEYTMKWKLGYAPYLSIIAGALTIVSTVGIVLTKKEFYNHRVPYHPKSIPMPAYVFFPKKFFIPLLVIVGVLISLLLVIYSPLWNYHYEVNILDITNNDELGYGTIEIETALESPTSNSTFTDLIHNETSVHSKRTIYTDENDVVMERTFLCYLLSIGSLIFIIPIMFFISIGKLNLKNGLPLMMIPAILLLSTPLYFMNEFPRVFEEEFQGSEMEELGATIGLLYDGSFEGSTSNNTTYENVMIINSSAEWQPTMNWYILIGSGILYLIAPICFIIWRKEFISPKYVVGFEISREGLKESSSSRQSTNYMQSHPPYQQVLTNQIQPGPTSPFIQAPPTQSNSGSWKRAICHSCRSEFNVTKETQIIQCPKCSSIIQLTN